MHACESVDIKCESVSVDNVCVCLFVCMWVCEWVCMCLFVCVYEWVSME